MINSSLNIAWSIAEIEAAAAGFRSILPSHFWMGCCKGCDLDLEEFFANAPSETRAQQSEVARDFEGVRNALSAGNVAPTPLRRILRKNLGVRGETSARPLHRHPDLRTAFTAGKHLAEISGGSVQPAHVLLALLRASESVFEESLVAIGGDRKRLAEAL